MTCLSSLSSLRDNEECNKVIGRRSYRRSRTRNRPGSCTSLYEKIHKFTNYQDIDSEGKFLTMKDEINIKSQKVCL
jgi:hypothetical protein